MTNSSGALVLCAALALAGDLDIEAQTARAHLLHVPAADVEGTGNRRFCLAQPAELGLYVLITEAINRGALAAGAFSPERPDGTADVGSSQAVLSTLDAHNANGWGWQSVTVAALGCYRTGAVNARVRLYRIMLSR